MILSPWPLLCFSTSMCAPVADLMALILLPPLPITLLIAFKGTETFLDLKGELRYFLTTSFQPSSLFPACLGLVEFPLLLFDITSS
uniref:Uncharacterized protein n=1 Tax=Panstrongylus lignarius TaxID=156445 RepID=A0A224Y4G5_9HEMI